jgi:hypothetical protein
MEGNVQYKYIPEDQKVNQHYCVEVLKRLKLTVCRKRSKKQKSGAWAVYRDIAPAHTAHLFQDFF